MSVYDVILPTPIPDKGAILTQLSLWWFEQLKDLVPNHVINQDVPPEWSGRAIRCRRVDIVPVECIARGYLAELGLESYRDTGSISGVSLPAALPQARRPMGAELRRGAGYKVQHFSCVEPQRRLAPHLHTALRGAIPRQVVKAVTKGTYLQLWWPPFQEAVYLDRLPTWDRDQRGYRDPDTGLPLPTWHQALDALDSDEGAQPVHVMRFGSQVDIKGIDGASPDADRAVRYLTKYLTKAVTETFTDPDGEHIDPAYLAHIDRLHQELAYLPCSPECANWLRYGVQPKNPGPGLVPGHCPSKAHDREHLGLGGRRVLVSRKWSGKTLTQHKADRAAVVRQVLQEAGIDAPEADRLSAEVLHQDGQPRFVWNDLPTTGADYTAVLVASVMERRRWRAQYDTAKQAALGRDGPPVDNRSATTDTD